MVQKSFTEFFIFVTEENSEKNSESTHDPATAARERAEIELLLTDEKERPKWDYDSDEDLVSNFFEKFLLEFSIQQKNIKKNKKFANVTKRKSRDEENNSEENIQFDIQDERWRDLLTKADFALDPTDRR